MGSIWDLILMLVEIYLLEVRNHPTFSGIKKDVPASTRNWSGVLLKEIIPMNIKAIKTPICTRIQKRAQTIDKRVSKVMVRLIGPTMGGYPGI